MLTAFKTLTIFLELTPHVRKVEVTQTPKQFHLRFYLPYCAETTVTTNRNFPMFVSQTVKRKCSWWQIRMELGTQMQT